MKSLFNSKRARTIFFAGMILLLTAAVFIGTTGAVLAEGATSQGCC